MEEFIYSLIDFDTIKMWGQALVTWPLNVGFIPLTVIVLSGFLIIPWAVIYKIFFIPRLENILNKKIRSPKWAVGLPLISMEAIILEVSYYIVSKYVKGFKRRYLTKRAFTPIVKDNLNISYFSNFEIMMAFIFTVDIILVQISTVILFGFSIFMFMAPWLLKHGWINI